MRELATLKFKRVVHKLKPLYKLESVTGVYGKDDLPETYVVYEPHFWEKSDGDGIETPTDYFSIGDLLTEDEFQELTSYLRECGTRLADISKKEAELRKTHYGVVVFEV